MGFSRHLSRAAVFAAVLTVPQFAQAQSFDPTQTDPQAIAQECGGDAAAGLPHFEANCAACHSLSAEASSRHGPHLAEVYGRPAGGLEGFRYSPALSQTMVVWEGETLHRLLSGEIAVPGHPVLTDDQMRRDLLTYLRLETRPAPPAPEDVVVPLEVLALEGDAAWGEYLSGDCVSCHNAASVSSGVAPIGGWNTSKFVTVMHQYRLRALPNEAMQLQAMRLSDEEIAALAAYFAELGSEAGG
jgi:cytochrome c